MTDWATLSSWATAAGTLVLAVATFSSVRSANRAARVAERSFRINLRPILVPSRLEDPTQKVMFVDRHWVDVEGGKAAVEVLDGVVYLAMLVRNVGNGMAVIEAWRPHDEQRTGADGLETLEGFRDQTRALWVPPGDVAFWQGALRESSDEMRQRVSKAVREGAITLDLLYRDYEGGQRTISRFSFIRRGDTASVDRRVDDPQDGWWISLSQHRHLYDT